MAEIKLTKNELRNQQVRLVQLERYLPTLQLKKAMLQSVVQEARQEIDQLLVLFREVRQKVQQFSGFFTVPSSIDFSKAAVIEKVYRRYENIAGVEVPYYESLTFKDYPYNLFDSPPWSEGVIHGLRKLAEVSVAVEIAKEKKQALEKELREVSIRVNLFEKILIPRAQSNIKKIKIFLGDLQLAAVSQAKIAKAKIVARYAQGDAYA